MYSAVQLQYLKAMGIPAWESRTVRSPPASTQAASADQPVSEPRSLADWLSRQSLQQLGIQSGSQAVPLYAHGAPDSSLLVLSDASGDGQLVQPFSGAAGRMLDAMLRSIDLGRTRCQVAMLASGPAANATGLQAWVSGQTPRAILYLTRPGSTGPQPSGPGAPAADNLLAGAHCIISYHPEFLLANPALKQHAWQALLSVRRLLE